MKILFPLLAIFILSSCSVRHLASIDLKQVVVVKEYGEILRLENEWKAKDIKNYELTFSDLTWITGWSYKVRIKDGQFYSGKKISRYDDKPKDINPRLGKRLTVDYFFALAKEKFNEHGCVNYSFFTDSSHKFLVGYQTSSSCRKGCPCIEDDFFWPKFTSISYES